MVVNYFLIHDYHFQDKEYSLFGLPKQDKYVLYGGYADPTLIRNKLNFDLSRSMGKYLIIILFNLFNSCIIEKDNLIS